MDKFRTLYDVCYDILYIVTCNISNLYHNNEEKMFLELYNFLISDSTQFEQVFDDITYFKFEEDKTIYKRIMMLIVVSSSYYLSLYQYEHDISPEVNLNVVEELEQLSSCDIVKMFNDLDNNPKAVDYVEDYMDFSSKNYIFRNGCMETILKKDKLRELLKINPFEIVNYINYVDLDNLLTTEKYIQEFIDLYDASLSSTKDNVPISDEGDSDEYHETFNEILISIFRNKVNEYFDEDEERIHTFYSYIFSNIYETLTVLIKKDKEPETKYQKLLDLFAGCNCNFEELYMAFMEDDDIAFMIIDFFVDTNDDLYEEDLITKRDDFMEVGDIDTLRDLNPYYDEENIVFEQIKQKEYPN